jgi:hypothetical protein
MSISDFFRSGTPARYIAERQQRWPPRYAPTPADWNAIFGAALKLSTPTLQALDASGRIVSGEVGELVPSTRVTRQGRGYAIEMFTGQMRLVYSAARAFTASDSGRFRGDKTAALSPADVADKIADLFRRYEKDEIATVQAFPATPDQTGWADAIARGAERFLLLHELAHIHNGDLALWRRILGAEVDSLHAERAADATACRWMIKYVAEPKPGGPQRQMLYAGAEFGLRVRMAMETVGMQFNPTHPAAGDRVAAMRRQLRDAVGRGEFYTIAGTALNFDLMWRAVELMLKGKKPVFDRDVDDVAASLRMLTVELLRAGTDVIQIRDVPGEPGVKRVVIAPANPKHEEIMRAARDGFREIRPDVRDEVERLADEIFTRGSVEFSVFLALLTSSLQPRNAP